MVRKIEETEDAVDAKIDSQFQVISDTQLINLKLDRIIELLEPANVQTNN